MGRLRRVLAGVAFGAVIAAQSPQPPAIDDGRQWIDSKGRIAAGSPAILRAAVATAFNDVATAEQLLHDVIRTQPRSDPASHAHLLLSRIYLRRGQYARLFDHLDAWAAAFPDRQDVREEQKDIGLFRGLPDQNSGPRQPAILPHEKDEFSAPISINGTAATYLLDTGAWISVITEAEAARLGLEVRSGTGTIGDASGTGVKVRTAVAKELTVGPMRPI